MFLLELSNKEPEQQPQLPLGTATVARAADGPASVWADRRPAETTGASAASTSHNGNHPRPKSGKVKMRKSPVSVDTPGAGTSTESGMYWAAPEEFHCMQSLMSPARPEDLHATMDLNGTAKMARVGGD